MFILTVNVTSCGICNKDNNKSTTYMHNKATTAFVKYDHIQIYIHNHILVLVHVLYILANNTVPSKHDGHTHTEYTLLVYLSMYMYTSIC